MPVTTESERKDRTAILEAALDALPLPVLIYDDTHVLYANRAAHEVLGADDSTRLQGMRVAEFILPALAEVNDQRRAYVMKHGVELKDLALKIRGLDGHPTVLQVDIRPISFSGETAAMATLACR
jgi:PAS domain S-box-containing protein